MKQMQLVVDGQTKTMDVYDDVKELSLRGYLHMGCPMALDMNIKWPAKKSFPYYGIKTIHDMIEKIKERGERDNYYFNYEDLVDDNECWNDSFTHQNGDYGFELTKLSNCIQPMTQDAYDNFFDWRDAILIEDEVTHEIWVYCENVD